MPQASTGTDGALPPYVVLSVERDAAAEAGGHSHVVGLTTRDPDGGETRWTLVQVIAAIRDGERFLMGGGGGGQSAVIEPAVCPQCPFATLIVEPTAAEPARV